MSNNAFLLGIAAAICGMVPALALADFYDCFNDGVYQEDPNVWDVDDPCWCLYEPLGHPNAVSAETGELWLWTTTPWFPYVLLAVFPDTGDRDPNTSETFWDDSTSHYIVARVRYDPGFEDPNDRCGRAGLFLNGDQVTWEGYALQYDLDGAGAGWIGLYSVEGFGWPRLRGFSIPRCDEPNGFWMAIQFESDGNPDDPNGKALRGACWDGDKYDWDGTWQLNADLGDPNSFDQEVGGYWPSGGTAVVTWSDAEWGNGFPAQCRFDNIEARTAVFTNVSHTLDLTVSNTHMGTVTIDPDLLADANNIDPNDYDPPNSPGYDARRRYTDGTPIVLVARANQGKSFKGWVIYDPNHPGDANHITQDANAILYLTMDADWQIEAAFKCGGGVPPFVAIALLALGLGAMIRRAN